MAGTNPIEKGPNQVANAQLDLYDIDQRRQAMKDGVSLYGGLLEDRHVNILPAELLFEWRKCAPIRSNRTAEPLLVFSTFNGTFCKTDTILDIIASIHFVGLAVKVSLFDESDTSPDATQVSMLSGLKTIEVNSKERIPQGCWLYWCPPDLECPEGSYPRKAGRYLPLIKVYDPEMDRLTKQCMMKYARGEYSHELVSKSPLAQGTREFFRSSFQIGLLFLHSLFRAGIIDFQPNMVDRLMLDPTTRQRRNAAAGLYNRNSTSAREFFLNLSSAFDLLGGKPTNIQTTVPLPNSNQTKEMNLRELTTEVMFGEDENFLIVGYEPGTDYVPDGDLGMMLNNQHDVVDSMYNSITKTNEFTTSRIFGKSLSPGVPGGKMDIQCAHALTIKYC